jgi:4-hydroxythreonine-4-phosphate dehydrogenase
MLDATRPVIALTPGDPAGVGPEIALRALAARRVREVCRPLVIGDPEHLEAVLHGCDLPLHVNVVQQPGEIRDDPGVVDVVAEGAVGDVAHGEVRAEYGAIAARWIERAVALAQGGAVDGLVTGPLNKEALKASGSTFPGHTEMLAALFGVPIEKTYTMFVVERLRIFFLTRHHPLATAIGLVTTTDVRRSILDVDRLMRGLGFEDPRIAVAALNPHGGEHGLLGTEEDDHLAPAVRSAAADGIHVRGPIPADSVFWQCRQGVHDAVISLYHDQGHVAAKTLDFFGVVSCTLGLPVIRTSAEHGTAFDIAGRWTANPRGQEEAMLTAADLIPRLSGAVPR